LSRLRPTPGVAMIGPLVAAIYSGGLCLAVWFGYAQGSLDHVVLSRAVAANVSASEPQAMAGTLGAVESASRSPALSATTPQPTGHRASPSPTAPAPVHTAALPPSPTAPSKPTAVPAAAPSAAPVNPVAVVTPQPRGVGVGVQTPPAVGQHPSSGPPPLFQGNGQALHGAPPGQQQHPADPPASKKGQPQK